ncbi:type II toxin-antitoxin system prevent-host-death family antitoxin [Streptomyces sp. NPDC058534]|uniref:type II toxin-antitoxin system prevent-host-death family antitoxin n=1 Tax=Streptomyces sp. NPDC058534 TaxID=3346541 RepID=UPI0036608573
MSATYPIAEAQGMLGQLVRRAAQRERITLTNGDAQAAVLLSPAELADLEDALAVARLERDRTLGHTEPSVPHDRARRALLEATRRDV